MKMRIPQRNVVFTLGSRTRSKPDQKRKNRCIAVAELPVRLVSSTPKAQYERLCRRRGSRLYHTHTLLVSQTWLQSVRVPCAARQL